MSNVIQITEQNYMGEVHESPVPILLEAYSPTCAPCRTMAPILDELAEELAGTAKVAKFDVTENPMLTAALRIFAVPVIMVLKNGRQVARFAGVVSKAKLLEALKLAEE